MPADELAAKRRSLPVAGASVAYLDAGSGPPVLLLHGCPFSSFVWRKVIERLTPRYRCLAPDLLGLGDTETSPAADWSLPAQAAMVVGLLDALGVDRIAVVGHDHGGAVAQLLAAQHPERITRLVIADAECYDNWPSRAELPFIRATQLPVLGRAVLWAWSRRPLFKLALSAGRAVQDRRVLTRELLDGYIAANLATGHRRAKTRRFLAGQLDPANQRHTGAVVTALRRFDRPTMLVWARNDPHFGPEWARRLSDDIPGTARLELLDGTGHLLMEEKPAELAALLDEFLATPAAARP